MIWFEKHLINPKDWKSRREEMPQDCRKVVDADPWMLYGGPVGIGHCEELGWFIACSGQGPFVAWSEKEYSGTKPLTLHSPQQ